MYKIDYFEIFSDILFIKDRFFVIPELCKWLEWDDEIFINHIRKYVSSNYHTDSYNSSYVYPTSMDLFNELKKYNYFSIFSGIPSNSRVPLYNDFYQDEIYKEVVDNLIFLGWNPRCYIGSAITDGYYPILLSNKNAEYHFINGEKLTVNEYGLISTKNESDQLCEINNNLIDYNEGDLFYSTQVYVDKNTFEYMKNKLASVKSIP
ncbi:hypothetical protein [Rodentibacter caecimuris]|uniref:hypothetical protein n=1 Tax=Rodentibacter caecimuris TaxID=1796644 RepID=UPI002248D9B4|nr:hypothetical protein [Rodentibacter heylii]MCX2962447.1 hypothetical protein [Rodentibacter heylii]